MEKFKNILIVEDSPTQLEHLQYMLEQNGYTVIASLNGAAAKEVLKDQKPDLIITDIIMPELDGYGLCELVKQSPDLKHIPVMLLTNLSDPKDVIKGLQAGADNFLTKPYNEQFLLSRIRYILINQELRGGSSRTDMGIEIMFGGNKYFINSNRMQIIDLLLSTYENAIQKNGELAEANQQLVTMHREIAKKNLELQKLNEEKNKFLRMAAHDLRNPIGVILSYSMIILDEAASKLSEDEVDFVETIKRSSEFVLTLLNELLDIAVIESGQVNLNLSQVDIVSLIENNINLHRVQAANKNITIEFKPETKACELNIDNIKIEQVLNNLVSNAIKFSQNNSIVTVGVLTGDDRVTVYVEDNGPGIPISEQQKLFQPFARTSVKSTAGEKSTGLGLSIVKKIIESHNGEIWVESEVGKGSKFAFSLKLST